MVDNVKWSLELTTNLINYLGYPTFSDVQVICKDGNCVPAHRLVLSLVSSELQDKLNTLEHASQVHLDYLSDESQKVVLEVLGAIYTGKIDLSVNNYKTVLLFSTRYRIRWLREQTLHWINLNIKQIFSLDFIRFTSTFHDVSAAQSLPNDLDLGKFNQDLYRLIEDNGQEALIDFRGLSPTTVTKIAKFSRFNDRLRLIQLILDWVENNPGNLEILSLVLTDDDYSTLVQSDIETCSGIEKRILTLSSCSEEKSAFFVKKFEEAYSTSYIGAIVAGELDIETMTKISATTFVFLLSSSQVAGDGLMHCRVKFILQWLEYGTNHQHLNHVKEHILRSVEPTKLYAENGIDFKTFVEATEYDQMEVNRISETYRKYFDTVKKFLKLATTERWRQFTRDEVIKLIEQVLSQLNSYSIIGSFIAWIEAHPTRADYKKNWKNLFKAIGDIDTIIGPFIESIKKVGTVQIENGKRTGSYWDQENEAKLLKHIKPCRNEEYAIFFEGIFPMEDNTMLSAEASSTMCTLKRQAGEFTKGSRIMTFKNKDQVIRIGFDSSQTPPLFKYQTRLTGSRRPSAVDGEDVTSKFVTIWAEYRDCFINMPFMEPETLEALIGQVRTSEDELKIFVLSRI